MNTLRRLINAFLIFAVFAGVAAPNAVVAQTTTGSINGSVTTQTNGLGVSGATVALYSGSTLVTSQSTDAQGQYAFANVAPGIYSIVIQANGFATTRVDTVVVTSGATASVRTPLLQSSTSNAGNLRVIGSTSTNGISGNTLASSSTIQYNIDPQEIQLQGFLKAADAIGNLPGVNITGGPHTLGDDTTIDIRGMGAGETLPLLNGHPIGPIGVFNQDYYNYVNSPFSLLQNIQVTEGSGATGLYGVDVIGGTIDFQTLRPTAKQHFSFNQQYGDDGTLGTIAIATGTFGRLGYALGYSVQGSYGQFVPGSIFQGARPNNNANLPNGGACTSSNDISGCNTQLNTYAVSGNYKVLSNLGTLKYNFTPTTALTLSGYASNTTEDSTGNGDNDSIPYQTRLAQIQSQPETCPGGYTVITDSNPNACLTAQQWASSSYGPYGGGAGRARGTSLQDFDANFTTQIGMNAISLNTYSDYYNFHKYSSAAAGLDPTGSFYIGGGTYEDNYLTHGFLATDDIASAKNDVGFGYFVEHQRETGNNLANNGGDPDWTNFFVQQPDLGEGDYSFFVRDNYTPSDKFAIYFNAWDRRSSVTQQTTLDPRISFVFKPTARDVVRLTAGEADGDPAANVAYANALSGFSNASSLNPVCNGQLNSVATGGNGDLKAERSKDLEAGYGHRFWADTSINVVGYVSSVADQLFSGVFPITPAALANPSISSELPGFASKINSACGTSYTAATVSQVLGLSGVFNASSALFRGIEVTGRIRATRQFSLDFVYDMQSSQQFGEPVNVLMNNPYILDGGQIVGIPLQKGSLAFNYINANGLNGQLEGYYIGNNNTLNRPAYTYFTAYLSKSITKNATLTLSAYNVFNQNVQQYGYFGEQQPNNENQYQLPYNNDPIQQVLTTGFATSNELLGLNGRLVTLQLALHF